MDTSLSLNSTISSPGMEINKVYTYLELIDKGLEKSELDNVDFIIFQNNDKVFFFEPIESEYFRLYSIISKKSFFL